MDSGTAGILFPYGSRCSHDNEHEDDRQDIVPSAPPKPPEHVKR